MVGKFADLTPSLFEIAFYVDEIAFAKMLQDVASNCCFARHAQNPSHARDLTITG
jgi:hypothetical protein